MYRSGSTVSYQATQLLVKALKLPYSIDKEHQIDWSFDKVIYTFRDIRDACASMCQLKNCRPAEFKVEGRDFREWIDFLLKLDAFWRSKPCVLCLKYREFRNDLTRLVKPICVFLNGGIDPCCRNITSKLEFDKNLAFSNALSYPDPKTQMRPHHMTDGKVGKWWTFFTDKEKEVFADHRQLQEWLGEHGFA